MSKPPKVFYRTEGHWILSALLTLPMALMLLVMLSGGKNVYAEVDTRFAFTTVWILNVFLFFKMLYTGKTDRYRAVLFILFAFALSFTFIIRLIEARGSMVFSNAELLKCEVPFCHIVTTMILIPAAAAKSIIFPGSIHSGFANISTMLVLVLGSLIIMGRGFCSWGCFYGGWDDGASRLLKKKKWKHPPDALRWGGFAVFMIVAVTSAMTLVPTYCDWACPFKAVTEFESITNFETAMKTVVFASLFGGLVIITPMLTKKRTQCAWFCPMGAFCSVTNGISPFQIKIDTSKCIKCRKCIDVCPMQALDMHSLESGRANIQCSKCGKCADVCPQNAIGYHIRFTQILKHPTTARMLYLYASFGFLTIFSGGALQQSILYGINFIATGRILP